MAPKEILFRLTDESGNVRAYTASRTVFEARRIARPRVRGLWVRVKVPALDFPVFVGFEETRQGALRCIGVTAPRGHELTSATVDHLPIGTLAKVMASSVGGRTAPVRWPQGTRGLTDEELRAFAKRYRQVAREHPRDPTRRLAAELHLDGSNIRRRIERARAIGLL